ncbi:MAG: hypothetical protein K2X98_05380, partial [Alphaproteobacteria bacterium]|nr:hypothetical protein [Alphaproteobacteria bacterium]
EKLHTEASGHEELSEAHGKQADHHAEQADHHGNLAAHHGSQLEGVSSDAGHVEGVPTEELVSDVKEELLHEVEASSGEMPVETEASIESTEEVVQ